MTALPTPFDNEFDLDGIAQQLSELSQRGTLPDGVGSAEPVPFLPEEVRFDSNEWLTRVVAVEPWMFLEGALATSAAPAELATDLFNQLDAKPSECFQTIDGVIQLTEAGAEALELRLSRAVAFRTQFQEWIDSDRTRADASDGWRELWEEADSQTKRPIAQINARVDAWKIKSFAGYADDELLDLNPTYQRDVVWSTTESQMLVESVLRGIPLPSVILTKAADSDRYQIVDGKQRLTAILRFMGHHPDGRAFAKGLEGGLELLDTNFRKFARKNQVRPRDLATHFLPFKLPSFPANDPLGVFSGKYYCEILDNQVSIGGKQERVKTVFERESDYKIPLIVYESTRIQHIHHVFGLYNKQGKKLNAEELRNAMYHHLHLTRLLLVLSGDRPDNATELASYLPHEVIAKIPETAENLRDLGFGTARFKRTKVLSWTSAILLHGPKTSDGLVSTPSTASHINAMLDSIDERTVEHPLFQPQTLVHLARDLQSAVDAIVRAQNAWPPRFKNKKGLNSKWEELPLIATMGLCFLLAADGSTNVLVEKEGSLREFLAANPGPKKTQNKTQWEYIAQIITGALGELGLDANRLGQVQQARYGYNCLETLQRLAASARRE